MAYDVSRSSLLKYCCSPPIDHPSVSVGFFDDMYIPAVYLPQPSAFDPNERAHFWLPSTASPPPSPPGSPSQAAPAPPPPPTTHQLLDSPLTSRMYIDQNEILRVRVESDEFYDDEPGPPKAKEGIMVQREEDRGRRAPYSVVVRFQSLFHRQSCLTFRSSAP